MMKKDVKDDKVKGQPFRYASYFFDEELEQYYLMARYYHPKQGVFLSVDPELSYDETVEMNNAYSYSANNPVMKYDSTGRWAWVVPIAITAYKLYKHRKKIKRAYRTTKYFAKKTYKKVYKNVKNRYNPKKNEFRIAKKSYIQLPGGTRIIGYRKTGWHGSYRIDYEQRTLKNFKTKGKVLHAHVPKRNGKGGPSVHYPLHPFRYKVKEKDKWSWWWWKSY